MHADLTETRIMTRRLSPERLGPYVIAAGGDTAAGLDLYSWNTQVSAALATTIGHVEVVVRNAMHENLTIWSTRRFAEPRWYLDPGRLFQPRQADVVRDARRRLRGRESPGHVVAELTLGF